MEEESSVTKELRLAVIRRDNWHCQNCGREDLDVLTVHHVIFRSQGGRHHIDNLVTLCVSCHNRIHSRTLYVKRINGIWYFQDVFKNRKRNG